MDLDREALEKAREAFLTVPLRRDDERPLNTSLEAAILAYKAAEKITEEQVEAGAREIRKANGNPSMCQAICDGPYASQIGCHCERLARACLQAVRDKGAT